VEFLSAFVLNYVLGKKVTFKMKIGKKNEINVEAYYTRYGPMVLRRCRGLLQDNEKAFDALQDVFEKLLLYRESLKGTYPSALLYRIATNVCLNKIRDERPHQLLDYKDILVNISTGDNNEYGLDANRLLEYIIKGEKESTQKIAVMYFVDGMTLKEIAKVVGLSTSGTHKRLKELRVRLKEKGDVL
jgi:RNA polymerase sigma-70 factor (ECF subfamily)